MRSSQEFPQAFRGFQSKPLIELIANLSNRKPAAIAAAISPGKPCSTVLFIGTETVYGADRIQAEIKYYAEMLTFLKSEGALLSSVRPEFLLSEDDYRCWIDARLDHMTHEGASSAFHREYSTYYRRVGRYQSIISVESWITVVLQITKLYVFNSITPKHFKSQPGVESDEADYEFPFTSNAMGASEVILLKWLSYTACRFANGWQRVKDFGSLRDGVLFAQVLSHHLPSGYYQDQANSLVQRSGRQQIDNALKKMLRDYFGAEDETTIDCVNFTALDLGEQYGADLII
jgi:hypothetical protein